MDEYDIWNGLTYFNPIFFFIGLGVMVLIGKIWRHK